MGLSSAVVLSAAATVRHGLLKAEDRDNEENIAKKLVDDRSAH
jgi:hypothetical protein